MKTVTVTFVEPYLDKRPGTYEVPEHVAEKYRRLGVLESSTTDDSDLSELTVDDLRDRLRELDLPVSGRKHELVARLNDATEQEQNDG